MRRSLLQHTGWQITGLIDDGEDEPLDGIRRQIIDILEREGKAMRNADNAGTVKTNRTT